MEIESIEKEVEFELVYDKAAMPVIAKKFPNAKFNDASDQIHPDRISVEIPETTIKEFYEHALEEGYALTILGFQFRMHTKKKEDPIFWKMCDDFVAKKGE